MKKIFKEYFTLNTSQRIGMLILLLILSLLILIKIFLPYFYTPSPPLNSYKIKTQIDSLLTQKELENNQDSLNITDSTFQEKNDTFFQIKHFKEPSYPRTYSYSQQEIVELNSLDSVSILKIRGVPRFVLTRILKYKELLGGYSNTFQLKEIYGMNDTLFSKINAQIKVDPSKVTKINVNTADFKILLKHPYLEYPEVKKLVAFRKSESLTNEDVNDLLGNELYVKIAPYLSY